MVRTYLRYLIAAWLAAQAPAQLGAQERESSLMTWVDRQGRRLVELADRPLHPVLGSVAPGGGVGAGLAYRIAPDAALSSEIRGVYTVRGYSSAALTLEARGDRWDAVAFGRLRNMPKLDFYGLGSGSDRDDRSNFAFRDGAAGLYATLRLTPWLSFGARAENLWPEIARGKSSDVPSIEQIFAEGDAPGLAQQPRTARYEATLEVIAPAAAGNRLQQGGRYRASYAFFDDHELDRFSFRRFEIEGQHRFAPTGNLQRLTLHGWLSTTMTRAGQEVPFYLQRTLGGAADLQSVRDERIGSDGTQATLRGFPFYRFRDRHLLLLQAEYRLPLWGPVDANLFAEAGRVASRRDDIKLTGLERSFGAGLSVMRGPSTATRLDIGFGGGEGARLFLTIGRELIP